MSKSGMTPKTAENLRLKRGLDRGTKLRRLRVAKGYSQSELSALSGVPLQTLRRYEQSPVPINGAKLKTLVALCLALNAKMEDVIESEELLHRYRATK